MRCVNWRARVAKPTNSFLKERMNLRTNFRKALEITSEILKGFSVRNLEAIFDGNLGEISEGISGGPLEKIHSEFFEIFSESFPKNLLGKFMEKFPEEVLEEKFKLTLEEFPEETFRAVFNFQNYCGNFKRNLCRKPRKSPRLNSLQVFQKNVSKDFLYELLTIFSEEIPTENC